MSRTPSDWPAAEQVEQAVDKIIGRRSYWFPVRHHSPITAFFLRAAIESRRPKLVLIEGPSEAGDLIPLLLDRRVEPPVAIYSSFEDVDNRLGWAGITTPDESIAARWASWSPLVDYSPEWIAVHAATKIGAQVRWIDLPFAALLKPAPSSARPSAVPSAVPSEDTEVESVPNPTEKPEAPGRLDASERVMAESDFYRALAQAGGYHSWEEGWDSLFESREFSSHDEFRRDLLTFCCAARSSANRTTSHWMETIDRERFMVRSIRETIDQTGVDEADVMIVCGGFHCDLDLDDETPPPTMPEGRLYTTLVPYSWFQIAELSGYAAGVRAPRFYSRHWESLCGKIEDPVSDYIVAVLRRARKLGEPVSSADAISITTHAQMLAELRHRPSPILDDLHDAIMTCCCKGDPRDFGIGLQQAIDEIDIGSRIGKVPEDAPRLPIVKDFDAEIIRHHLQEFTQREKRELCEVDRREPAGEARSAFFHRLRFLNVPFVQLIGGTQTDFDSGLIFRESWWLKWSPKVEAKLIELNLQGDSILTACTSRLRSRLQSESGDAGKVSATLVDAMKMDVPALVARVFDATAQAIEEDGRFASLTSGMANLEVLGRYLSHHDPASDRHQALIADLQDRVFDRSCFAMQEIVNAPDDQHAAILSGLTTLADRVMKAKVDESQRDLFANSIENALQESGSPFLRGALLGLAVEIHLRDHQQITDEIIALAHSTDDKMIAAGDLVHGIVSVSRAAIMSGSKQLIEAMDELIRSSSWEAFTVMLPRLRAAMEMLHRQQRQTLARRVAELYGLAECETLQHLEIQVDAAAEIARLDREVAEIMAKWSFA